jgi:DNA-binding MarR family transcriptional regulator
LQQGIERDAVDQIVEEWGREMPDLDPLAKAVTHRIMRLTGLFDAAYTEVFKDQPFQAYRLQRGEYGVLAALRRAGSPFALTPTELGREQKMTSGGITAAVDRLERKALVRRQPNPGDRRGTLVYLTPDGNSLIEAAMRRHADVERELVTGLSERERAQLAGLLRRLLLSVET